MKERILGTLFLVFLIIVISLNIFNAKGLNSINEYQDGIRQEGTNKEERFFYDEALMNSKSEWVIQVNTYENIEPAMILAEELENQRFNVYIIKKKIGNKNIYRVRIYSNNLSDTIQKSIDKLEKLGYSVSVIRK